MRCLYCGKELALLKRLRGGGEFCSEAHRKEYQEQYEQLALARLLQAKPAEAGKLPSQSPLRAPETPAAKQVANPAPPAREPGAPEIPTVAAVRSVAMIEAPNEPPPSRSTPNEEPAPLAGFLQEAAAVAVHPSPRSATLEFRTVKTTPNLPAAMAGCRETDSMPPAEAVEFGFSLQALEEHTRTSDRGVESREFAGPDPQVNLHLQPSTGPGPAGKADPMEISMSPHPPQKANPWLGPPKSFPSGPVQLGALARLDFTTTGLAYTDLPAASESPAVDAPLGISEVSTTQEVEPPAEPSPAAEPAPPEPVPPALVTKPLPVTLHGLAASRGKLVQVFSAIGPVCDIQIPVSAALPLRPTIVFGPAPVAPATEPAGAPEAPKPQAAPARVSRTAIIPPPEAAKVKERAVPVPEGAKPQTKTEPESEAQKTGKAPVTLSKESEPPSKSAPVSETAVPSLRVAATESAWSKLSTGLKIGIAAAVVAGVAGIGYLVTRDGNKPAAGAPGSAASSVSGVAAGVPISGGWIDDWADAAKSKRRISLLSGSAKLSDYRMEFQAQIESKAIGWIFRGLNPKNYYVAKLETIKPGLEPTVALVHFAVVDGQDESRVAVPLTMKLRVDTVYKVRFEAVGNHFTAWVQDQQVAEWSDSRFGSGGVGFFAERDEKAAMQGPVNVVALVPKN